MDEIVQPSRTPPLSQLHSVSPQVLAVDLQLFHLSLIYEPRPPSGHYRAQQIRVPHGHGLLIHFLANFFKYAVLHSTNGCVDLRSHFAPGCGSRQQSKRLSSTSSPYIRGNPAKTSQKTD